MVTSSLPSRPSGGPAPPSRLSPALFSWGLAAHTQVVVCLCVQLTFPVCLFVTFIAKELFSILKLLSLLLSQAKKKKKKSISSLVYLPLCVFLPQKAKANRKEHANNIAEFYHKNYTDLL